MERDFKDADFHTASMCLHSLGGHCVAVAHMNGIIAIRDTKDKNKSTLQFTKNEWQTFVYAIKNGEFDF